MKLTLSKKEKKDWIERMKERKAKARQERENNLDTLKRIREIIKSENADKMKLQAIINIFQS